MSAYSPKSQNRCRKRGARTSRRHLLAHCTAISLAVFVTSFAGADERSTVNGWQQITQLSVPNNQRVAFVEARKTLLQKRPRQQRGELWITEAGKFLMQVTTPKPETRTLSEQTISLTRNGKTRTAQLDPANAQHQVLLAIVHLLQGDTAALQALFSLASENDRASSPAAPETNTDSKTGAETGAETDTEVPGWTWQLVPNQSSVKKRLVGLELSGHGQQLSRIRAEFHRGWQEITLLHGALHTGD